MKVELLTDLKGLERKGQERGVKERDRGGRWRMGSESTSIVL